MRRKRHYNALLLQGGQGLDVGEEVCSLVSVGVIDHLTNAGLLTLWVSIFNLGKVCRSLKSLCHFMAVPGARTCSQGHHALIT